MSRLPKKRGITQADEDKPSSSAQIQKLNLDTNVFGLEEFVDSVEATFAA